MSINKEKIKKWSKVLLLIAILIIASYRRVLYFDQTGKDLISYEEAVTDLFNGINPYLWTIQTYTNTDDIGGHGYAYLPGFMYLFGFLYLISLISHLPIHILFKIPVLIADLSVGYLIYTQLKEQKAWVRLLAVAMWFFNPYSVFRSGYTYVDPLPTLLCFLALIYLEKDDVAAGVLYSLSVLFKTFPVILFPIFLIKSRSKVKFLLSGLIVALFFSIPFIKSVPDALTYLQGSLLIHGDRVLQGRPFLFYISYYMNIGLFQIIPIKVYSLLAVLLPMIVITILYFVLKIKNKYALSTAAFVTSYIFTPVLNRTYLIWFLPCFLLYLLGSRSTNKYLSLVLLICYYIFWSWYLIQWEDGFHITRPM